MAILKLTIVPAKVLTNGRHKIRIALAHNSGTRYIPTDCIVNDMSQFKEGQVVNHPNAAAMNVKLRNLFHSAGGKRDYRQIYAEEKWQIGIREI